MAPFNENGDLVYRIADDGSDEPIYPFNRIRLGGDGDLNYPQYRHLRHHTEGLLKYPEIAAEILKRAMWEIRGPSTEQIRQRVTDEEKAAGVPTQANYLETIMYDQLHDRAEWQLVSSTPEEMTISIFTHFTHPWAELRPGQEPIVHFRISARRRHQERQPSRVPARRHLPAQGRPRTSAGVLPHRRGTCRRKAVGHWTTGPGAKRARGVNPYYGGPPAGVMNQRCDAARKHPEFRPQGLLGGFQRRFTPCAPPRKFRVQCGPVSKRNQHRQIDDSSP